MAGTVGDDRTSRVASPWTHNVVYGLAATGLWSIGGGLYWSTVLPNFILHIGGSNAAVGLSQTLQGVANMASALPAGYLADRWSRMACIRLGAVLQLAGNGCLIASVLLAAPGSTHAYVLCCVALSIQGVCDGIMNGPLVALMDDSVPAGRRSDVETANSIVGNLGQSVGPTLGLCVFLFVGNAWTLSSMRMVITIGLCINQVAIFPAWRMNDAKSLGEQSEAVHLQRERLESSTSEGSAQLSQRSGRSVCCGAIRTRHVRLVMFAGEIILATGAGMTVKFFPIFFDKECHFSPAVLQSVFASLFLFVAMGTWIAKKLSGRFGRMQVIIPGFTVSVTCTALLGLLRPFYELPYIMLPVFILRCASAWSLAALLGSVVADYTPKASRARWKSVTSVIAATWSGSAAIGGLLIDRYGFGLTFLITACFQATVLPIWCSLTPLIAKESELLEASAASGESLETALAPQREVSLQEMPAPEKST